MEILQLRYFCYAAETQSFTKTARKFMVPVPNISQTMKKLENELGVKLFNRYSNHIALNDNGVLFYSYISRALALIENSKNAMQNTFDNVSGKLRILALSNRDMVSLSISQFHRVFPYVEIILETSLEQNNFQLFDLIVSDEDIRFQDYPKTMLLDDTFRIIVSKESQYAHQHSMTKKQIENEKFITLAKSLSFQSALQNLGDQLNFVPSIVIACEDPYCLIKFVSRNLGVAFIPSKTWKNRLNSEICMLPIDDVEINRHTYLYRNPKLMYNEFSIRFQEIIRDMASML